MTIQLSGLVESLLNPEIYPHKPDRIDLMQTQMSLVFLAGHYVYKIKKPVDLGYLDYTTLDRRLYFCHREVELNQRLCPDVYLGVVPITRNQTGISFDENGEIIEYAVKMLYLPQERMLNVLLENEQVLPEMIWQVARRLAEFHASAASGPEINSFGEIATIRRNTDENFTQTEKYIDLTITRAQYNRIQGFTVDFIRANDALFQSRVDSGRIRDGHGDLHSQHICFTDGICIFDCIEFNDRFRYGDAASDIAFLAMDLDHYGRADLSRILIQAYSEFSRDKQIYELLKFYKCYRAYIRGKVDSFKYDSPYVSEPQRMSALSTARSYFDLADAYSRAGPALLITVGLTGSGKSTLARGLARHLGLTVISSDVVRKQLAGVAPGEHRFEPVNSGIYSAEFSRRTYDQLFTAAREVLSQGDSVILDASFIRIEDRLKAIRLAEETHSRFLALECRLDEEITRQRLEQRMKEQAVSDGRWEIFLQQRTKLVPVTEIPPDQHLIINTALPLEAQIKKVTENY